MEIIKTNRLEIRPFSKDDVMPLSELLLNADIKKTYMIPDFSNQEELNKMVNVFMELSHSDKHFTRGIYTSDGLIGFVNDVVIENAGIELGYAIHPTFAGNGYATEMLQAVINALLGKSFSFIKTGAFSENIASIRVMEKCNMRRCPQTEVITYRGKEHVCVYYEIGECMAI